MNHTPAPTTRILTVVAALAAALAVLALPGAGTGARVGAARPRAATPTPSRGLPARPAPDPRRASPVVQTHVAATLMRMPLQFEANRGQTDPRVKFLARGKGYTLFLTGTEAVLCLSGGQPAVGSRQSAAGTPDRGVGGMGSMGSVGSATPLSTSHSALRTSGAVVRMKMQGASAGRVAGLEELPGKANYFVGSDPKQWRTNVPTYGKVRYHGVYRGVDLVYYGNQGRLEYDFLVAPGADPKQIRMAFKGADNLSVDKAGDLVLRAGGSEMRFRRPIAYQEIAGRRVAVAAGWTLGSGFRVQGSGFRPGRDTQHAARNTSGNRRSKIENRKSVSFRVARYDASRPLVIDPVLAYSSYLGGAGYDSGAAIAVDSSGNAYVTGSTNSANFPVVGAGSVTLGGACAFVTKMSTTGGGILYSTYLGGNNTSGSGIAVDATGNAHVIGQTGSASFPTVGGGTGAQGPPQSIIDTFLMKLSTTGDGILYSTCLGGYGHDYGNGVAVDGAGNAWVAGTTLSADFPVAGGGSGDPGDGATGQDIFVAKIDPDAGGTWPNSLIYSSYLGGSTIPTGALADSGEGIAVDGEGNAYVTGFTNSPNFPVSGGGAGDPGDNELDVFVVRIAFATGLSFLTQPANTPAGALLPEVQVRARDAGGTPIETTVTLSITPGTGTEGATLSGTVSRPTVGGVATFTGLKILRAGTGYTLTATVSTAGLDPAVSRVFNITVGSPHHLGFLVHASNTTAGQVIAPPVSVAIMDRYNNVVPGAGTVTLSLPGRAPAGPRGNHHPADKCRHRRRHVPRPGGGYGRHVPDGRHGHGRRHPGSGYRQPLRCHVRCAGRPGVPPGADQHGGRHADRAGRQRAHP